MLKKIYVPTNLLMNNFFNLLVQDKKQSCLYDWFCDLSIFLEWLKELDFFNEKELYFYKSFYVNIKKEIIKNDLSIYLSDNFEENIFNLSFDKYDYFFNLLKDFEFKKHI